MKRTAAFLSVLLAVAFALAAGCIFKSGPRGPRGGDSYTPTAHTGVIAGIDFNKYWPREKVVKLSPEERASLLELSLEGLKGVNWEHARDVLVALGDYAIPSLVKQVQSGEETAAAAGPLPVVIEDGTKTLGQLSHDILLTIVQYHSNYKGQLPVREQSAWEAWWKKNKDGLEIR